MYLAGLFALRVGYGLSMPFWSEDERQVYLIGLRSFARNEWPHFGADVVWTGGQVPGALLGWLIRGPLTLWPAPEAPVVLANVLSFSALALLAWYLVKRLPQVPRWLVWSALFVLPWTLNFSTHVVNPSFVLPGAVVFFIGFFEALPALRRGLLPWTVAWACLGAGLLWMMQIHMSWVLLPPFIAAAAGSLALGRAAGTGITPSRAAWQAATAFATGALLVGALLLPTFVRYGIGAGHVDAAVHWQPRSPLDLVTTAARVLSFASFGANRFLGQATAERVLVLARHPWIGPFALIVAAAGIAHPIWMAVSAFRRTPGAPPDWTAVRALFGLTVLLIYVSYFFSVRGAQGHAFYVVFPVGALYAFTCWQARAAAAGGRLRRLERVAVVVLVSTVVMHAGIAIDRWPTGSLYADRALVAAAIDARNDRWLGDRRGTLLEARETHPRPRDAVADREAFLAARATEDLHVATPAWTPIAGRISRFSLDLQHRGRHAAWLDVRYATTYMGADGQPIASREGVLKRILQPGQALRDIVIADGLVPDGAVDAVITVTGAERVIPLGR